MPRNLTASVILQEVEGLLQPLEVEDALAGEVLLEVGGGPRLPGNRVMLTPTLMGAGMEIILTTVMPITHGIHLSGVGLLLKLPGGAGVEGCQPGLSLLLPLLLLPLHARLPPLRPLEAGRLSQVREEVGEGGLRHEEVAAAMMMMMTMMTAVKKSTRRSEALDRLHPSLEDDDCYFIHNYVPL